MSITVENVRCGYCMTTVTVTPDRATGTPEAWTPTSGICPNCGNRLNWSPHEVYINSFKPEGAKEGEVPVTEIKIIPKD